MIFLTIITFSGHFANVIKTGQEPKDSELGLAPLTTGVDKKSAKSNIEILTEEQEGDCQEEEEYYDDDFEGCRIFQTQIFFVYVRNYVKLELVFFNEKKIYKDSYDF